MSSNYNGVGYTGSPIDTIGDPLNGVRPIQDYLTYGSTANINFIGPIKAEADRILQGNTGIVVDDAIVVNSFLRNVYDGSSYPKNLEEMIVEFRVFAYSQYKSGLSPNFQVVIPGINSTMTVTERMDIARTWLQDNRPGELDFRWSATGSPTPLENILTNFRDALGISDWTITMSGITGQFTAFAPSNQILYLERLFNANYAEYVSKPIPKLPPGFIFLPQWVKGFNDFSSNLVVPDSSQLSAVNRLSYENFYNAFFNATAEQGNFDAFFDAFVQKIYGDPDLMPNPIQGEEGYFVPSLVFDKFTEEVLGQYFKTLGGSTPLGPSASDAGSAKTLILNRIYSLLVNMIEALQKVAAAQSDRLLIFSKWQKAYTDLQNQIKYVSEDDDRFNSTFSGQETPRGDFNSQNASYTEIIKANKSVIGDDAKNLQTQINQSTDAVNQQASMATSILQQLAAIFSSLYR